MAAYSEWYVPLTPLPNRDLLVLRATSTAVHSWSTMSHDLPKSPEVPGASKADKFDELDANIRNFAPVARIMKNALPDNAKIAKEAKECMQECVSEFISFITSEGTSTEQCASSPTNIRKTDKLTWVSLSKLPKNASKRSARRSMARIFSLP